MSEKKCTNHPDRKAEFHLELDPVPLCAGCTDDHIKDTRIPVKIELLDGDRMLRPLGGPPRPSIRECLILAYLGTIATPVGTTSPRVVSRAYLREKLLWLRSAMSSTETDPFANLDPHRERFAMEQVEGWGYTNDEIMEARGPRTWNYELGNTKFITRDGEKP